MILFQRTSVFATKKFNVSFIELFAANLYKLERII